MRKLSPAYVVTTVVIAVAGTAFAQSAARPAGTTAATSMAKTASLPTVGANRTNGEVTGTFNNGTSTSTDSTSANGNTTTTTTTTSTGTGNSTGANGSRSGTNTNSSAANTAIGSTSANGTTGANGTTTTNEGTVSNGVAGVVLAPGVVNPGIINRSIGTVTSDGERVFDNAGKVVDMNNANVQLLDNGSAGAAVATETARSSQSLDKAIKQAERDRKKIGRNGQLLQSIAPRTSVDRSDQMPDDGPSPALSGSASALNRR